MPATVAVEIRGAAGSGVIVNKEGLVLTAAHVVGRAGRKGWVELPDGRRLRGKSLGADHDADAGMMQIDDPPADLPFVPVSQGPPLAAGQWVVTIGQPGGIVADLALCQSVSAAFSSAATACSAPIASSSAATRAAPCST